MSFKFEVLIKGPEKAEGPTTLLSALEAIKISFKSLDRVTKI